MPQATQVFNGVMFITNPYEARSFIRVDVLERRFADAIKTKFEDIVESCGQYPELYELPLLYSLRKESAALPFPHNQLFKREAERQGLRLDDEYYHAVEQADANLWGEIN